MVSFKLFLQSHITLHENENSHFHRSINKAPPLKSLKKSARIYGS